ncbi:UNVERIFIED_CONTAM: LOB domain-containing protein 4 [Sesamum angustifolium]|uniref:LOB domain-containing protein 4 n=1 Tax=Sesamum angustifolium TaxID=2727405 RepID=A0AAW2QRT8_9LAMI
MKDSSRKQGGGQRHAPRASFSAADALSTASLLLISPPKSPTSSPVFIRSLVLAMSTRCSRNCPEHQRGDAVSSMVYEANARVRDPVYGCVGAISSLQQQIDMLQTQLALAQAEVVHMRMRQFSSMTNSPENASPPSLRTHSPIRPSPFLAWTWWKISNMEDSLHIVTRLAWNGAEVCVLKTDPQESLSCPCSAAHGGARKPRIDPFEILSKSPSPALKRKLPNQAASALLVLADLPSATSQGGNGAAFFWLLRRLSGCFPLPPQGRFSCCLLSASH